MKIKNNSVPKDMTGSLTHLDKATFSGETLVDMKYITQLIKMTDKWIYAQIQKGQFPKPLKLGRSSRWKYSEICDWLERVEHARKL